MTPADFVKKWSQRTSAASEAYTKGVQAVTENPMEKAAAKADQYAAGVAQAVATGRYQDGLRRVGLQEWRDKAVKLGAGRLAAGVKEAEGRMQQFAQQFLPFQESLTAQVRSMPNNSLEERINRAIAQMRGTSEFKMR